MEPSEKELESKIVILANTFFEFEDSYIEHSDIALSIFNDQRRAVTYYGEIQIPLKKSTKQDRLKQAYKDLRIRIHNKITELKNVLAITNVLDSEGGESEN